MFEDDEENLKPSTFICHACERGACVASCGDKPVDCLLYRFKEYDGNEDVEPVWKRVHSVADNLRELLNWGEGVFDSLDGVMSNALFPDWFYALVYGFRVDRQAAVALQRILVDDDYKFMPDAFQNDLKDAVKKYKKDEIAQAFASLGFGYGLVYGEWRKRIEDKDSFEILDDDRF